MSKVYFWFFSFIETKSLNIDLFTNENYISLSVIGFKFLRRKEKNFLVNKLLWIMAYKNVKAHTLGHLRAATNNANSCLGLSCGCAMLGQLLCDMSCIANDNRK